MWAMHCPIIQTIIPMRYSWFVDRSESLCETRWPHILLSDCLYLTVPITACATNVEAFLPLMHGSVWSFLFSPPHSFFLSIPLCSFNSGSHSYASWISNAYLWSGLVSAACLDSMTDSTSHPSFSHSSSPSPARLSPPSWQHGCYLLNHTRLWARV